MTSFFIADRHALRIRLISEEDGFQAFRRAQLRSRTLRWLTQLSDRQYEFASGKAMESLGSNRVRVTAGGNEYGMDFLAIVPAFSINPLFLSKVRGIRIIGQAKKYSDPVSRDKIQSFNDCVSAVKYGNGQAGRVLPAWFLASDLPILGCYVAHSGFQAGARKLANEMGHILLDSVGLAEIIANPRSFDIGENLESIERTLWGCLPGIEKKFAA